MSDDSQAHAHQNRQALAALEGLIGSWAGEGTDHGEAITARLQARWILDESFVEVTEQLSSAAGEPLHEDRTIYRYDAHENRIKVLHLLPGGWCFERVVSVERGRIVWQTGPFAPQVVLSPGPDALTSHVQFPGSDSPDVVIEYERE